MPATATVQTSGQRYRAAVTQAVREGRGIKAQTQYLTNRIKGDAGVLWYLFETYIENRVRADLEAAAGKVMSRPHVVPPVAGVAPSASSLSSWRAPKLSPAEIGDALNATWQRSRLYTYRINGQLMSETTGRELHQFLASHSRDNKFYRTVAAGIAPTDTRTLGEIYKGPEGAAEIEAAYQKAENERKSS
jgi:hypothetical protein